MEHWNPARLQRPLRHLLLPSLRRKLELPSLPHTTTRAFSRGQEPNWLTLPFLIRSCSEPSRNFAGMGLHCRALKWGMISDLFVVNNLISMYAGWVELGFASKMFDESLHLADVVSWTALVSGYSNAGELGVARWYFDRMPCRNVVSWNAMIAGYARSGSVAEARRMFDAMPERNVASWSAMISGFSRCGLFKEVIGVFGEMIGAVAKANTAALVSAVSACAQLRALEEGEWVYNYIKDSEVEFNVVLWTALVDMYGKCGEIGMAVRLFNQMSVKNVRTWNAMIMGLAMNGAGRQALALFGKMNTAGVEPNALTFVGVLSACSHAGLIDEGQCFFGLMIVLYEIKPMEEHYGCMVDLLGRAGLVKEAVEFMDRMPVGPHPELLGALAGACRIHGNADLGEVVGKRLVEMEPRHGGRYALLLNILAAARKWDDAAMVSKMLRKRGVMRVAGHSYADRDGVLD